MAVELTVELPAPERRVEARAGMAMSLATFAMAIASAAQAVLYLGTFGVDGRTDGFFLAFALYTTFGVFSQSLRLTAAPLLVEPHARLTGGELLRALLVIALPVMIATGPLAGPLAHLIAPGLSDADRAVTQDALPILGAAVVLQLLAAGGATILAVRGRFGIVATAYAAGALAGLIAYGVLYSSTHELVLGWSMLTMAAVTGAVMAVGVMTSGGAGSRSERTGVRPMLADAALLLGSTVVYLAFNLLLIVTLAFASREATGDATTLSYAYLFASYLVAGTAMALGMSRIPEMTRQARAEQAAQVRATVPVGFRYAMLLVAPMLAALVAAGAPLVGSLMGSSLDANAVESLRVFGALLALWTVAALLVNLLLPLMFATGRARLVNLLALPLAATHVAVTAIGSAVWGVEGAVAAFGVAPLLLAIALIVVCAGERAGGLARELLVDTLRFGLAAAAAFGLGELVATGLADGVAAALLAGVLGAAVYVALLPLVARQQVAVVLRAVRPHAA